MPRDPDSIKREYDFSKGERGKFHRPEASLNLPIYLEDDMRSYLEEKARPKGVEIGDLVAPPLSDKTR